MQNYVQTATRSSAAEDERYLIVQLYFLEKTEREIAALEGIYHNAVHKRKLRILSKLKKLFEEI